MTIFILGTPEETAKALDDKALGKMVSACAQVLCNAQCELTLFDGGYSMDWKNKPPLGGKDINSEWSKWARECRANYLELVEYASACCVEYIYRTLEWPNVIAKEHKHQAVITWCADNVPDLPLFQPGLSAELTVSWTLNELSKLPMPFPLVMPDKYKFIQNSEPELIESYRAYYKAKLRKRLEKCSSTFGTPNEISGGCKEKNNQVEIKWTRRQKSEWLGDL